MSDQTPAAPVPDPAAPAATIGASIVKRGNLWHVSISGIPVDILGTKGMATSRLAREAISRQETIVAIVRANSAKSYLSISPTGVVSPAAAPPPGALHDSIGSPFRDGHSGEDSTREWVEESLLVGPEPEDKTPRRSRRPFARLTRARR